MRRTLCCYYTDVAKISIMILIIWTSRSVQTLQALIRLLHLGSFNSSLTVYIVCHLLDALLSGKTTMFNFRIITDYYSNISRFPIFLDFYAKQSVTGLSLTDSSSNDM